jgi:hypothetical protein
MIFIFAMVIVGLLFAPILLGKSEVSAVPPTVSDGDSSPRPGRTYVSADPRLANDTLNDFGFTSGPVEHSPSFANANPRGAPPELTSCSGGVHSHYSWSATKAERAQQEAMDPRPTGWGSHSHE